MKHVFTLTVDGRVLDDAQLEQLQDGLNRLVSKLLFTTVQTDGEIAANNIPAVVTPSTWSRLDDTFTEHPASVPPRVFRCEICGQEFGRPQALGSHRRYTHPAKTSGTAGTAPVEQHDPDEVAPPPSSPGQALDEPAADPSAADEEARPTVPDPPRTVPLHPTLTMCDCNHSGRRHEDNGGGECNALDGDCGCTRFKSST